MIKMIKTYKFNLEEGELLYIREKLNPEVQEMFMELEGFMDMREHYIKVTQKLFEKIMYYLDKNGNYNLKEKLQSSYNLQESDKYYFVKQMFYLIYRWTDAGRKNYCNTNNATSDQILKKWLDLAKELKFFDGNFFNSDDYKSEYEIFLKNWGDKSVSS
ncbi:MAG: hypothetical protein ACQESN_08785 [Thermotogota bacterium]